MPEHEVNNANAGGNNTPAIAAGAAVAGALAVKVVTVIYDKMTGDYYSEGDQKRLAELKRLYQEAFNISAPTNWDLDNQNRPTHRVKNKKWALHVQQMREFKQLAGHYHYQTNLITEYASTYLINRGGRWVAGGKPGDLVEQFIGDWINFALNDLPALGFDAESVKKIEQRIAYIEQVQKHESIFQFGQVTRAKNKFDTIESIKQQLVSCVDKAAQESLRQCAREKFDICRADIEALLLSCTQTIYYARETDVYHEPLELLRFIKPDEKFLTVSAQKIYPAVKATHTGAMLAEVVSLAGLKSFGVPDQQDDMLLSPVYFTKQGEIKSVNWEGLKSDLPPWVESKSVNKHLSEFQLLGGSILRVANLKKLIEDAYDLTGKVGDLWAYGDVQGKLSLKALLFLLEKEVNLLKSRYDTLYKFQNEKRHAYNLEHRVNPNNGLNPNFNKVDAQKKNIDKLYNSIKTASQSMKEQMAKFPENAPKRIDDKKSDFYKSISKYLKQFYPDTYSQYHLLEKLGRKVKCDTKPINVDGTLEFDSPEGKKEECVSKKITLTWSLIAHQQCAKYLYLDKPQFKPYFDEKPKAERLEKLPKKWILGNKYAYWMKSYFIYNQENYDVFQKLARTLQEQVKDPVLIEDINFAAVALRNHIKILRQRIENERPKWRFKLSVWPIRTKGWPFNRDANRFSELLLKEFDSTIINIDEAIKESKKTLDKSKVPEDQKTKKEEDIKPSYSLTDLDKGILNALKDPNKIKSAAAEFTQLNKNTTPSTTDPSSEPQVKDEPSLDKKRETANQWVEKIKNKFLEWQTSKSEFIFFNKRNEPQKILKDILEYRDSIPKDLLAGFVNSWDGFRYLLNIEVKFPEDEIDEGDLEQMKMMIKLIDLLKTEDKSSDRKIKEDEFILESQRMCSKQELHKAACSYQNIGFLGGKSPRADGHQQQIFNSPSVSA